MVGQVDEMLLGRAAWGALGVGLWPMVGRWGVFGETCVGWLIAEWREWLEPGIIKETYV